MSRVGAEHTRKSHLLRLALLVMLVVTACILAIPFARANATNLQTLRALQPAVLANPQPALSDYAATLAAAHGTGQSIPHAPLQQARPAREAALRAALARGDTDAAEQIAATLQPLRCDLAIHLASSLLLQHDEAGALRAWSECAGIVHWFNQQGDRALDAGNADEARIWFERGAALPVSKHDTSLARLRLARLVNASQGWPSALPLYADYQELVESGTLPSLAFDMRTDRDTDMWEFLAVGHSLRERDGDCNAAAFWYDLAARREPGSEYGPLYQGICAAGDAEKRALFQQVIGLNPANDRGYYWMGITEERSGDCAAAIPWFLHALERNNQVVPTRLALARCYEQTGAAEFAAGEYRAILVLQPDYRAALQALERLEGRP